MSALDRIGAALLGLLLLVLASALIGCGDVEYRAASSDDRDWQLDDSAAMPICTKGVVACAADDAPRASPPPTTT